MSNICDGIKSSFDSQLNLFNSKKNILSSKVNDMSSKINTFKDVIKTPIDDVKDVINGSTSEAMGELQGATNTASSIAGSCLDGLFDGLKGTMNGLSDFMSSMLPSDLPEVDLLGALSGLSGMLDSLGISNMIGKLDELLGCLGDSGCISISEIEGINSDINSFLTVNGLSDTGEFDQDAFLGEMGVPTVDIEIMNQYTDTMADATTAIEGAAKSAKEGVESVKFETPSLVKTLI